MSGVSAVKGYVWLDFWKTTTAGLSGFHALTQLANLAISIILAKQISALEDISNYEQVNLMVYFFSFFWISGLWQSFQLKFEVQARGQLFTFYALICTLSIFFMGLTWLFQPWLAAIFFNRAEIPYLSVFIIYMMGSIPVQIIVYWYFHLNKGKALWFFSGLFNLTKILCFIVPLWIDQTLLTCLRCLAISGWAWHIWMLGVLIKNRQIAWSGSFIKLVLYPSLTLSGYALLGSLTQMIPAWIIKHNLNDDQSLAIYRYGAKEIPLLAGLITSISLAQLPQLSKDFSLGLSQLKKASGQLNQVVFPIAIIGAWTSPWLFPIVFEDAFYESGIIFCILLLTTSARLIFSQTILMAVARQRVLLLTICGELCINIFVGWGLAGIYGLTGIAIGIVAGYIFEKGVLIVYLSKSKKIYVQDYYPVKSGLIYNIVLWVSVIMVCIFLYD